MDELPVSRFVQGLGGGGLGGLAMAVLADVVPAGELGRWLGYQGVLFAISSVAGPLVGGLFADHLKLAVGLPHQPPLWVLVAMAIIVTGLHIPYCRVLHRLDWFGLCLPRRSALAGLVLVATLGGVDLPWTSAAWSGRGWWPWSRSSCSSVQRERRVRQLAPPLGLLRGSVTEGLRGPAPRQRALALVRHLLHPPVRAGGVWGHGERGRGSCSCR